VRPSDYMRKVRLRRAANLILFLVDASWSMAVAERMQATKGAIPVAADRRLSAARPGGADRFQKNRATLVLPPTNSVVLANRALVDIPVGGKTRYRPG